MAISDAPFANTPSGDVNRIRRITFVIGSVKTASHLDHVKSGSVEGYERVRDDSTDPQSIQVPERQTYIDEEA